MIALFHQRVTARYGLLIILIVHVAFFTAYNLQKHAAFETAGHDLGNHDQALWNTLRGYPLSMTTMSSVQSRWQLHFEPTLLLLVPIYAVFSSPQALLVLQTIIVALGAIPVFLLARQALASDVAGLVFAIVYLLFPALQGGLVFDFHTLTLSSTLLAWAFWLMANRKYRLLLVAVLLAMGCKENVPLLIIMLGGYIIWVQRQYQWGIAIGGIAILWFVMANFIIIPLVSPVGENIHLSRYSHLGDNMQQVIGNLVSHPLAAFRFMFAGDRLNYWIRMTMPVAFIALFEPLILLIALPEMVINTLSSYPPNYQLDRFHYSVTIVPFVVVAGINGLARLVKFAAPKFKYVQLGFLQNSLLLMIFLSTLIYQVQFGHTPIGRYFEWPVVTPHHQKARAMLAQIPPQAPVAAQNNLVPHISQRDWIFVLPKLSQQGREAEYIALDMTSPLFPYEFIESYCAHIDQFLHDPKYGLIVADDGLLLFERNVPDKASFTPMAPCQ